MSSIVLDIDDWPVAPGDPAIINRLATYFLLMTGSDVDVTLYYKGSKIGSGKGLQGGDGIGPLSDPYDKIVLESATSQVCKVAVTSDPVTITRLSGVVQIDGVVSTTPDYRSSIDNKGFFCNDFVVPSSGAYPHAVLFNPSDSNKNLVVFDIDVRIPSPGRIEVVAVNQAYGDQDGPCFPQIIGGELSSARFWRGEQAGLINSSDSKFVNGLYKTLANSAMALDKIPTMPLVVPPGYGVNAQSNIDEIMSVSMSFIEVDV